MSHLIHRAAAPDGLVQRCADCGTVLRDYRWDYRNQDPHWLAVGGSSDSAIVLTLPTCTPQHEPPDCTDGADPLP